MVNLYFVRHGKTEYNETQQVQGWSDSPLTAPGVEAAQNTALGLADVPFSRAYTSDFPRAVRTAEIILENNRATPPELIRMEELREVNFGKYEGGPDEVMWGEACRSLGVSSKEELLALGGSYRKAFNAIALGDETGQAETYAHFENRLVGAVSAIAHEAEESEACNVLIVSHGAAVAVLLTALGQQCETPIENASVSLLEYADEAYTARSIGDLGYARRGEQLRGRKLA